MAWTEKAREAAKPHPRDVTRDFLHAFMDGVSRPTKLSRKR